MKQGKIILILLSFLAAGIVLLAGGLYCYVQVADFPFCKVGAYPATISPDGRYIVQHLRIAPLFYIPAEGGQLPDSSVMKVKRKSQPGKDLVDIGGDSEYYDLNYYRPTENPTWVAKSILRHRTSRDAKHLRYDHEDLEFAGDTAGVLEIVNLRKEFIPYVFVDTNSDFLVFFDLLPQERRKTTFRMTSPQELLRCSLFESRLTNNVDKNTNHIAFVDEKNPPRTGAFQILIHSDRIEIRSDNYPIDVENVF